MKPASIHHVNLCQRFKVDPEFVVASKLVVASVFNVILKSELAVKVQVALDLISATAEISIRTTMSHGQSAHGGEGKAGDNPMLNAVNCNQLQFRMKARFRKRGVWSLVAASRSRPADPSPGADSETRDAQYKLQEKWDNDRGFAAADLVLSLDDTQQVHVDGIDDDPVAMLSSLDAARSEEARHAYQRSRRSPFRQEAAGRDASVFPKPRQWLPPAFSRSP